MTLRPSDPLLHLHRIRERIRREELRQIQSVGEVPFPGGTLTFAEAAPVTVSSPGVYVIPWDSAAITADLSWSSGTPTDVVVQTPGLWTGTLQPRTGIFFGAPGIDLGAGGSDSPDLFVEASRLLSRIKVGGVERGSVVGAPYPLAFDATYGGTAYGEAKLEPILLSAGDVITAELIPGYGTASPSLTKLRAHGVELRLNLVCAVV